MLKIGVLGAGHLGKIHIKLIQEIENYELVGFFDPDENMRKKVSEEFEIKAFDSLEKLIDQVDVVDIVTPTLSHYDCATESMNAGKHVFIEKPVTNTLEEALTLLKLEKESGVKVQVGHVERFNPAFKAAESEIENPMFIEAHRLAQFNPRGTDVPVVLDLMIHDLDILLHIVKSEVKSVVASGVCVVSDTPDIANARITFENGCVANITASRMSLKNMRKTRIFQPNAYISVDFLNKEAEVVTMEDPGEKEDPFAMIIETGKEGVRKQICFDKPAVPPMNAIKEELKSFAESIQKDTDTTVSLNDGYRALALAHEIIEAFNPHTQKAL